MAIERTASWQPTWAVAPGEILLEVLEERGMTQSELARRMGRPIKTINEIIKGKAAITPETAIQLERSLAIPAQVWNNLESNYRGALAREQARRELEKEGSWVDRFPLRDLVRHGLVRSRVSKAECLGELLAFFQVSSRKAWEATWLRPASSFRASPAFESRPEAIAVWLRWGEIQAEGIECGAFDAKRFRQALRKIRHLTNDEPFFVIIERVRALCAECGVVLVVTPELNGAPVSGAARWLVADRALIQLSLRHKSDDQFWFSFFHEAGHVLSSQRRRDYIDAVNGGTDEDDDAEADANRFARDELIPPNDYDAFLASRERTTTSVRSFARELGIAPGIVVGRLHRDKKLDQSELNGLKKRIRWLAPPRRTPTRVNQSG